MSLCLFLQKDDDDYIGANLRFYRNEIKFRPNGMYTLWC